MSEQEIHKLIDEFEGMVYSIQAATLAVSAYRKMSAEDRERFWSILKSESGYPERFLE